MHIRIETASEQLLQSQYPELIEGLIANGETFEISEDTIAFGTAQDLILIGLVFVWESIKSGLTWDIVRGQIAKVLGLIQHDKLKKVSVYVESASPKRRYEIECSYGDEDIEIVLPEGLRVSLKHRESGD